MKDSVPSDFAGKVRLLADKHDGNQSEVARILGVSPSYIHEIVTGKKTVRYPRPRIVRPTPRIRTPAKAQGEP